MPKPRPCEVCDEVFEPHPRAGDRQRVCSKEECQRERHRRNCENWRQRNADYDRDRRLRARMARETESDRDRDSGGGRSRPRVRSLWSDPLASIPWDALRDVVASEVLILVEEVVTQVVQWARDAVHEEVTAARHSWARSG